jgi:serine/threonine protein kinase
VVQSDSNPAAGVCEGDILDGKYRVERVLGAGGMGVVVAAHHIQLDEKVALKFLRPEALSDAEATARFVREARNAVKIKSEHVARVIDVGTLPNSAPYIVMEYLEGGDLAAWLKQRGAPPIEQAIEFVLQACVAVAEAHALGIVHRDLKPANLFCIRRVDGQLSIKVLDFGISKLTVRSGSVAGTMTARSIDLTLTTAVMGSPLYMSPEQMRSLRDVDARTDIWALGIVLFELITGRVPFQAGSVSELAIKINGEPTPAVRSLRPEVPDGLEAIVLKCLEKERRQRYRNVAELALALLPFAPKRAKSSVERIAGIIQAAGLSASALAVPPSPQMDGAQLSLGTLPPVGRTTLGSRGGKRAVVGAGVTGAVFLIVVGSLILWKRGTPHHEDPPTMAVQPASPAASRPVPAADRPQPPEAPPVGVSSALASRIATTNSNPQGVGHSRTPPIPASLVVKPAVAAPPPAATIPARVDCDPPYVIDAAGHRQYKPECLK